MASWRAAGRPRRSARLARGSRRPGRVLRGQSRESTTISFSEGDVPGRTRDPHDPSALGAARSFRAGSNGGFPPSVVERASSARPRPRSTSADPGRLPRPGSAADRGRSIVVTPGLSAGRPRRVHALEQRRLRSRPEELQRVPGRNSRLPRRSVLPWGIGGHRGRIANARTRAALRAGGGAIPWVVRSARARAARHLPAPRGRLHLDPPRVGPHGEAALGRDPHAPATGSSSARSSR